MTEDLNDDFMQYLMDQLNKSYSEYKRNNPAFAKVVEEQLEGKTNQEFEAQFTKKKRTHCESCGEWLENYDICSQCGRINE
jgi:hypothetical protein